MRALLTVVLYMLLIVYLHNVKPEPRYPWWLAWQRTRNQ